ncbi:hypothetical protein [Bartonella vinsonii]|uniref:hypothetical protein n=1 Tax=Bartonella vinsonii TaxID=33047 RepID=UPI00039F541B
MALIYPPQINEQERIFAQLLGVWQRADAQTRERFCDYLARERGRSRHEEACFPTA